MIYKNLPVIRVFMIKKQIAFNLCSSSYNQETNNITLEVLIDKFFIDGVSKPIQNINGINCHCNLDPATIICCPSFPPTSPSSYCASYGCCPSTCP